MKIGGLVVLVLLLLGFSAGEVFAQAAAETLLTHSTSSAAGSSLGKTLGNALGNAPGQLAGRLGQQTSTAPTVQRIPARRQKPATASVAQVPTYSAPVSSSGSLVASIEGAATPSSGVTQNCPATAKPGESNASQSTPPPAVPISPAGPSAAKNCATAQQVESHPAVLNLPAAN